MHRAAEQQVVHGGIADHDGIHNLLQAYPGLLAQALQLLIQRIHQHSLQFLEAHWMAVAIFDAADHILAVGDLRVGHPGGGQRMTALQIHQVAGDLGGADIHCVAEQRAACRQSGNNLLIDSTPPASRHPPSGLPGEAGCGFPGLPVASAAARPGIRAETVPARRRVPGSGRPGAVLF